ncbi:MAG: hypothetical protein JRH15_07755 [Deltaproteobacteria bacterium]|nr:hypothetical protein [Deltaproteobacteria bacterium]
MKFMIEVELMRKADDEEIAPLINDEYLVTKRLMKEGFLKVGYTTVDYSRTWLVMVSETQETVKEVMKSFPLYKYIKFKITPLADF